MSPQPDPKRPLIDRYPDDPDMAAIVQEFVGELPARVEALAAAWRGRRFADLLRMAHQLKGCSAGYGFPVIGTAAATLEGELRDLDSNVSEARLAALKTELDRLIDLCAKAART